MQKFFKRTPLLNFLALIFLPELVIFILVFTKRIVLTPMFLIVIGSWLPNLSAILVAGLAYGKPGWVSLFSSLTRWRLPLRWYILALVGPVSLLLLAAGIASWAGLGAGQLAPVSSWAVLAFGGLLLGPLGEELGWRGFALPRLLSRMTPWPASLILGTVWGIFHLPAFFISGTPQAQVLIFPFMIICISITVFMTFLYIHTRGSLLPIICTHFAFNGGLNILGLPTSPGHQWLLAGLVTAGTGVLVIGGGFGSSKLSFGSLPFAEDCRATLGASTKQTAQ